MSKTFAHFVSAFFKVIFILIFILALNEVGFTRGEWGYYTVYVFPLLYMAVGISSRWLKKWWVLLPPLVLMTWIYHVYYFGLALYQWEHIVYLEAGLFPGLVGRKICKYEEKSSALD